jgi:hypothetical protein
MSSAAPGGLSGPGARSSIAVASTLAGAEARVMEYHPNNRVGPAVSRELDHD